ncbi:MAG: hypothetical protein KC464_32925, partial [Myxococcales bacterium]|nr:hypothetical protein [Myxococcales bacterium]
MKPTSLAVVAALCALVACGACGGGGDTADAGDDAAPDAAPDGSGAPDAAVDGAPSACPEVTALATGTATEVTVIGDPGSTMGIFDPSLVYPDGAPGGAMSYSSVPDQHSIRTRIALSGDAGASWTFVVEVNAPQAATITTADTVECPGGTCTGAFISEVSSLIIDPDDPDPTRRWKLLAHRYLVESDDTLHYRYGTITLQTAAAPEGPWTAPAPLIGWDSPAAVSSAGVVTNASALAGTADCVALTEPGALWRPAPAGGTSSIDLALGCVYLDGATPRIRIVLLRSDDHAASWRFVSDLLDADDAACLDADATRTVNAADLFYAGGVEYLAATPSHGGAGYEGCLVIPVDDPDAGAVRRDALGRVVPVRALVASPTRFAGACAYAEGATALGYV